MNEVIIKNTVVCEYSYFLYNPVYLIDRIGGFLKESTFLAKYNTILFIKNLNKRIKVWIEVNYTSGKYLLGKKSFVELKR